MNVMNPHNNLVMDKKNKSETLQNTPSSVQCGSYRGIANLQETKFPLLLRDLAVQDSK